MKNILFINHSIRDGGPGRSLYYLLKHFDYEQFNVSVLIPEKKVFSKNIERENLKVNQIIDNNFPENLKRQNFHFRGKKISILPLDIVINLFRLIYLLFDFKKELQKNKIDIIYCNGTLAKFFGAILGSLYSIKVVWHVRNYQKNIFLLYSINLFSNFDSVKKIICVSKSTMSQFKNKEKCKVVNNGIDTEEFNPMTVTRELREKFKVNKDRIIIGTAGRVVPRKNFEHFVQLGIDVCKKYKKDCLFVLVGDTPHYFGQTLMTKLKSMVKEENLDDKFIFTGYTDKVESYIVDFDIFFIPSMYEDPFPRVVIESMSLGKPVLGYNIGGIGEAIDHKINGYSFNLDDNSLIDSMLELIEDEELRLKMSFEARKKAVNLYDSRIIASKILDTIRLLFS
ncbi:glycosyltransferase family 4 protein [bacterium]|jgi:glycosyltransferase involved in cell wall biosynthesis|nr:glycosyltransferase family 4 protein [bacterium]MBT3795601.1 glycosyltransferase family 4 protein [bacterium]MBT4634174.1 glycosyltransferase family 4 protein [bacterium]